MADERITPSGWLPPVAPGAKPPEPAARPRASTPDPGTRNAQAVWALVLAVGALTLLLVSLGTFFILTLPCSVAAWLLAGRARRRLDSGDSPYGAGQITAALWIARIGVIAGVAAAVVFIGLLAAGFDFDQFRDDLERELDDRRERRSTGVRTSVEGLRAAIGR